VPFRDVQPGDWFFEFVRYLYCRGAVSGYSDNTFRPYSNTTRGQLCKIVVLGYNISIFTPGAPTFRDVPLLSTFYPYVETAYRNNLVSGYNCGGPGEPCPGLYFRADILVTRGQLSKIVVSAAGWPLANPTSATFSDAGRASPFYRYVETAYCHGIISGYNCGGPGEPCPGLYFRPGNYATRAQISKIVCLAVRNEGVCDPPPSKAPN
jgi:hypothetical protein